MKAFYWGNICREIGDSGGLLLRLLPFPDRHRLPDQNPGHHRPRGVLFGDIPPGNILIIITIQIWDYSLKGNTSCWTRIAVSRNGCGIKSTCTSGMDDREGNARGGRRDVWKKKKPVSPANMGNLPGITSGAIRLPQNMEYAGDILRKLSLKHQDMQSSISQKSK